MIAFSRNTTINSVSLISIGIIMERRWGVLLGAVLALQSHLSAQPQITQQPESRTAAAGAAFSFSVEAAGRAPLHYQWQFNGQDIPDARGQTLKRIAAPSRAGTYSVRVRDDVGEVVSSAAQLEVVKRPFFLVQPKDIVVGEHTVATFTTVLNNSGPYSRMIWHNSNPLEGPHEIPPSTGIITDQPVLRMTDPLNDVTWNSVYWLAVTNGAGGITSRRARLTVVGPPVLIVQPQNREAKAGSMVLFSVRVQPNPGPPETFQWYRDGTIIPGATARKLLLRNAQSADQGNHYCVVNGIGGSTTSWGAQLMVLSTPPR
jgi:hypothetical protein